MNQSDTKEFEETYSIKTANLPIDLKFMPTLCNGHVGFTIYGDAIFMNGVYNGTGGKSRRARIPNWLNIKLKSLSSDNTELNALQPTYELHLHDGYFSTISIGDGFRIEQRSYPHRYYTRALIYELIVQRVDASDDLVLNLVTQPGSPSEDLVISSESETALLWKGVTREREHEVLQSKMRTIFIAFSENLEGGKTLKMESAQRELYYRYVICIDENGENALTELGDVLALGQNALLETHTGEWRKFWNSFSIDIKGNLELAQTINAAIFYLANSLPSIESNQSNLPYYGLSPSGLGRGNTEEDYLGHNFWDTEIWMLPVVTQMACKWSKDLFEYRLMNLRGAEYNAQITGYRGARFPWESAFTGTEVTQPDYPAVAKHQVHISADIIFALHQFYSATNDREWLRNDAWPLARKISEFLVSRVEEDPLTHTYHVKDVMGPDEYHCPVTDNVYTNVVFKLALSFASFLQQQFCPEAAEEANVWMRVAEHLTILYDDKLDYHPQYLGYTPQIDVKQADVALLGYPLQFSMNDSTHLNDLNIYAAVTDSSGPAMTWSMYSINYLDVGDAAKADFYFQKSYKDYVETQFKVWSEIKIGNEGCANFLTGIGGFLQAIISGYGGIRFHHNKNCSMMEIKNTRVLPETNEFTIRGLKFANASFQLHVETDKSSLECLSLGDKCLEINMGEKKTKIFQGYKTILFTTAFIRTV